MQLPNYLGIGYKLIFGIWIIISIFLLYNIVDITNDYIHDHSKDKSSAVMVLLVILYIIPMAGFYILITSSFLIKKENNINDDYIYDNYKYDNYNRDWAIATIIGVCGIILFGIILYATVMYYGNFAVTEIQQLLFTEFENIECDKKLEILNMYKNATLNDLNNIEHNLNPDKELFAESDINELESNYKVSCLDSSDRINQILRQK